MDSYYDRKLLLEFNKIKTDTDFVRYFLLQPHMRNLFVCIVRVRRCCWYVVCTAVWVECQFFFYSLVCSQLQRGLITCRSFSLPCVGKQAVHDPLLVLRSEHHSLPQVVVLLLSVACTTHHPGLHEGGPRVLQQGFNAPLIHLKAACSI